MYSFCDKKWTSKEQLQENKGCYKDDFNFEKKEEGFKGEKKGQKKRKYNKCL